MEKVQVKRLKYHTDDRGVLNVLFDDERWVRAYLVKNWDSEVVRAYHGHLVEAKRAVCIKGGARFVMIPMVGIDETDESIVAKAEPDYDEARVIDIMAGDVIVIPPKFYHGWVNRTADTEMIFFSNLSFEDAKEDDYRVSWDAVDTDVWEVSNR